MMMVRRLGLSVMMLAARAFMLRTMILVLVASTLVHRLRWHFMHLRVVLFIAHWLLHFHLWLVLTMELIHTGTSVHCVTSKDGHHDEHSQHLLCLHSLFLFNGLSSGFVICFSCLSTLQS